MSPLEGRRPVGKYRLIHPSYLSNKYLIKGKAQCGLKAKKKDTTGASFKRRRFLPTQIWALKFNGLALKAKKNKVTRRMLIRDLHLSRQKISLVFYKVLDKR